MPGDFFVIREVKKRDGQLRLSGKFIVDGHIDASASSQDEDDKPKPKIPPPRIGDVKYVLPPRTSPFYDSVKHWAEQVEHETVEHDDFSYP